MAKKKRENKDTTLSQSDMLIANPIYDVVFKNLMTNDTDTNRENAGYFVGTILGEEISDIELLPQEYTHHAKTKNNIKKITGLETLTVGRLDFVATVRTETDKKKKVLIEIQKSKKPFDLLRFRTYLGEQYKKQDLKNEKDKKAKQILPIVSIYLLGFELPEVEAVAIKVNRKYVDMLTGSEMKNKNHFVECLTHDAYFIQLPRIKRDTYLDWEECNELIKMLSLFEQDYFIEENYIKTYPYSTTNKNIKKMLETLVYIATDPKTRRIMQEEHWAALNEDFWETENKTLTKKVKAQSGKIKALSNKNEALSNNNEALSGQIEVLQRLLKQAGIDLPQN
jgi:hypothetical protein